MPWKVSTEGSNLKPSNRILAYSSTDRAHGYGPWFVVSSNLTRPAIKLKGEVYMKLGELAKFNIHNQFNFEKNKKSGVSSKISYSLDRFLENAIDLDKKNKKEEVVCYLNGRAMTKSKLQKNFPKNKKNKSKRKYIKKKKTKE